jgi:hypothetical protein
MWGSLAARHPLKMSVTDITYKDKKVQVKFKLFTDDLEMTLRTFCNKGQVDLINTGFDEVAVKCLSEHMMKNFVLRLNGKVVTFKLKKVYMGSNADVTYVEIESSVLKIQKENQLSVRNTVMFSNIPEQKSVVNMSLGNPAKVETILIENEKGEQSKNVLLKQ